MSSAVFTAVGGSLQPVLRALEAINPFKGKEAPIALPKPHADPADTPKGTINHTIAFDLFAHAGLLPCPG